MNISSLKHGCYKVIQHKQAPLAVLIVILLLIGWVITQTTLNLLEAKPDIKPVAAPVIRKAPPSDLPRLASYHILGSDQENLSNITTAALGVKLVGVFINSEPTKSRALIGLTGQQVRPYKIGERLPNGSKVYRIMTNSVILSDNGQLKRVDTAVKGIDFDKQSSRKRSGLFTAR